MIASDAMAIGPRSRGAFDSDRGAVPGGEAELIRRVRAGDDLACEALVREHGGAMLACARRLLGCAEEAADAVQDAFLSAFGALHTFEGNAKLGTWLHRIVVNHSLMRLRRRKRRPTVRIEDVLPTFDDTGHHTRPVRLWRDTGADRLERAETRAQVRACIDRLPASYRTVILLRDIEGLDTDATAALLGTNSAVIKTRLHRARQALRTLLEPLACDETLGSD
jgi:RNA polymerase sigma-70 factor (ECF subfamily)